VIKIVLQDIPQSQNNIRHTALHKQLNVIQASNQHTVVLIGMYCDVSDCGAPPSVANGMINYDGTGLNQVATYTCDSGYDVDIPTIVCTYNGLWTNSPACVPTRKPSFR